MKCIKGFFQAIDVFGVPYSFKYKKRERYNTSLGGFIFCLFIVGVLIFGIYYFIPFYSRKNYSIIYYSMNMPVTDSIKLSESKASFAIGLACPFEEITQVSGKDLFDLQLSYIIYTTDHEGRKNKVKQRLSSHPCNYSDFYNNYNDTFDYMKLNQFECLDKKDDALRGIYTDEVFKYYEFSVLSKNDSVELFKKIDRYLIEQDCRLELYYTDATIDFDNYKEPINPYINSVFIQLNPTLFLKMNVYFKNQYFNDDNFLLFVFDEEQETTMHTLFSRIEDYSLYKGLDRGVSLPYENTKYANIYIRSDTSKTIIKRKYQKVMEFYADYSSLLLALFRALYITFYFINRFYANHSLSKQIFFFKEAENIYFDIDRKSNQIKNIIKLVDPLMEKKNIPLNINENKSQTPHVNEDININNLDGGINIYNMSKNIINKECLRKIDRIYKTRKIKFLKDDDYEKNSQNLNSIQNSKRNIIIRSMIKPVKISTISFKSPKEI